MRISRLLMPAVTLAGALALAGCGGGSDGPMKKEPGEDDNGKVTLTDEICGMGRMVNDDGDGCVDDPNYTSAKAARDAATALYGKINTGTAFTTGTPTFANADDDHKDSEILRAKGQDWLTAVASSGDLDSDFNPRLPSGNANEGYYPIVVSGRTHTVVATPFTQKVNVEHDAGKSFSGSYQGIQGTFKCVGSTDCTSSPATKTAFTLGGGWHFKPNSLTATLQGNKAAEWGWWRLGTGDDAGTGEVKLLYQKIDPDDGTSVITTYRNVAEIVAGEATYTGDALGQYAVVRSGTGSASGAFEAKAELTAKFGSTDKLSGRIHSFNVGSGWEVELEEATITSGRVASTVGETVWKIGDDAGLTKGDWAADLYGGSGATDAPEHILGGFSAVHTNARMVGAFGTAEQK